MVVAGGANADMVESSFVLFEFERALTLEGSELEGLRVARILPSARLPISSRESCGVAELRAGSISM